MRRATIAALAGILAASGLVGWLGVTGHLWSNQGGIAMAAEKSADAKSSRSGKSGKAAGGSVAVEAAIARGAVTSADLRAIGSLQSDESVVITSEVAGRVAEISFKEGGATDAAAVLVKLDTALAEADLANAQARYNLAAANNQRAKRLSRTGNVTDKAIDEATANFESARATVELQKVKLGKHTITAPFSGWLGMRKVSPGSFIAIGTPIVNLEKIDTLKVDFKLPEMLLSALSIGQAVEVTVDAYPGRTFAGEIYAIDPMVDVNGRAITLRARLANPDLLLRPGLFARITIKGKTTREVVLAPEASIGPRGGEAFVFRVEAGKAIESKVKLGERRGTEVEIIEGLAPNTQVVTAGQLKLRNGSAVEIVEANAGTPPKRGGS
jgi:membrane fusion protein (multidrug efflux system)